MSIICSYEDRSPGEDASTALSELLTFKIGDLLSSDSAVRLLALELGAVTSADWSRHVGLLSKAAMVEFRMATCCRTLHQGRSRAIGLDPSLGHSSGMTRWRYCNDSEMPGFRCELLSLGTHTYFQARVRYMLHKEVLCQYSGYFWSGTAGRPICPLPGGTSCCENQYQIYTILCVECTLHTVVLPCTVCFWYGTRRMHHFIPYVLYNTLSVSCSEDKLTSLFCKINTVLTRGSTSAAFSIVPTI